MPLVRGWQKQKGGMDEARAMLDSLMGPSRDKQAPSDGNREGFKEPNVCKRYLVGLCPNAWFKNTKRELEACPNVHSDQLAEEMRSHPDGAQYEALYEKELLLYLEEIVADADRWIARERGNVKGVRKEVQLSAGQRKRLEDKQQEYAKLIEQSTVAGDEGQVQESQRFMAKAQDIKSEIEEIQTKNTVETGGETVCEQCGVRYPLGDTPTEIGDRTSHLHGKMHEAYTKIREKAAELRKKRTDGIFDKVLAGFDEKNGKKDKDDRGRRRDKASRSRSRSRDKGRDKDKRKKDRSRSRKSRSRRRDKSRSRKRSRSKKDKSRSRKRKGESKSRKKKRSSSSSSSRSSSSPQEKKKKKKEKKKK